MKEYECAQVGHHKDIGKTIAEYQKKGWRLHTYSCTQRSVGAEANHYLLFEREDGKKMPSSAKTAAAATAAAAATT